MEASIPPFLSDPTSSNWSTLRSFKRLFQEERLQQSDGATLQQATSHHYSPVGKAVLSSSTAGPTAEREPCHPGVPLTYASATSPSKVKMAHSHALPNSKARPSDRQVGWLLPWGARRLPLAPTTRQAAGANPVPRLPHVPEATHPLHQMTGLCPHIPPSLPSRSSSSAAGSAAPAPQLCGTVKGASAGRKGPGRSDGPFPEGSGQRPEREHIIIGSLVWYIREVCIFLSSLFNKLNSLPLDHKERYTYEYAK